MLTALLALSVLTSNPSTPSEVVKEGNAQVQKLIATQGASVERLAQTADQFVDFGELARRALGKEWDKLSKKQQDEFSATMRGLLRASYAQKAMGQGTAQAKYGPEKVTGNEAEVPTTLVVAKEELPVVYKLYRASGRPWRIYDVVTDEVSLVQTYQDQFRKLISEKGFDGLLAALKTKKEQLEKGAAPSASNRPG
jgi:phospholipid transport system substrate-binding protein